jgi:hypothetical protein
METTLLGLELKQWLGFSVAAAVISTFGGLAGSALKEYLLARSFETWSQRTSIERVYQRYRDPILLSARELCARLAEVLADYPTVFLKASVLKSTPRTQVKNSVDDPYYKKYKLVSTIYRICALLGWIELYRRELVFLNSGRGAHTKELERCVEAIREDFADGSLNTHSNWHEWSDRLIFREELRAIGEMMIASTSEPKHIIGYAQFCDLLEAPEECNLKRWAAVVSNFILDLEGPDVDFRKERLRRLVVHLVDLLERLDEAPLEERFTELRENYHSAAM